MTAPSIGIKDLLVAAAIGVWDASNPSGAGSWPIYISKLPDAPDDCIAVYDTGGSASNPKWLLDYPSVTVMVRAQSYEDAWDKVYDCKAALVGLTSQDVNGDRWDSVTQIGGIANAGRDKKDRQMFTLTLGLIVEPASSALDVREPL